MIAEQALEGTASNEWVCFEKALVVNDLPSGGIQSFFSRGDAQSFRDLVYANHGTYQKAPLSDSHGTHLGTGVRY